MDIIRNIFAIIFYILLCIWMFFKIRNIVLVKKYNNNDKYKEIKNNSKKNRISKLLFKIAIILLIILRNIFGFWIYFRSVYIFLYVHYIRWYYVY